MFLYKLLSSIKLAGCQQRHAVRLLPQPSVHAVHEQSGIWHVVETHTRLQNMVPWLRQHEALVARAQVPGVNSAVFL